MNNEIEKLKLENKLLKQYIGAMIDSDIGIYVKEYLGKERTEFQNGWNAACKQRIKENFRLMNDLGFDVFDNDICIDEPEIYYIINK